MGAAHEYMLNIDKVWGGLGWHWVAGSGWQGWGGPQGSRRTLAVEIMGGIPASQGLWRPQMYRLYIDMVCCGVWLGDGLGVAGLGL